MKAWGTFGVGGGGTNTFPLNAASLSRATQPVLQISTPTTTGQDLYEQLRSASSAFAAALRGLTTKTQPIYTTSVFTTPSAVAKANGIGARLTSVEQIYSVLQTTAKVNTQTSTVRSSSTALGLDITSAEAASRLRSSAALALDITSAQTASTIASTAEMNTGETTAYGSSSLSFDGSGANSTSTGSLTGVYTGVDSAANATLLKVEMNGTAFVNSFFRTNVKFDVRDQNDNVLFSYNGNLRAGEKVYLGDDIGLSISFSQGRLTNNHTASTTVSHNPITVDPNAAFNASPSLRPQFENGAQVVAGSFTVNGTSIAVNANDTINTVMARINASAAGVTATLANDQITLTTNSYSEDNIVFANDTSGFVSATKLAAASTSRGNVRDDQQTLSKTTQFGSVVSGSFTVNGTSISVDKATDTLTSIISRINSAGAGVTASYDSTLDKVVLTGTNNSEDLITVSNDTSGFLAAAGLSTNNTVRGNIRDDQQVFSKTSQFAAVTTGSVDVNGVSISINGSQDTLQSVIDRINNAGAGVTASYNSATDKLVFTPDVAGSTLALENDTSGFLTAGKVSVGTVGTHVNPNAAFNATGLNGPLFDPGFSVQAGAFTINGVSISVGAGDSINTVLSRITSSAAGVTAAYDDTTQTLKLRSKEAGTGPITVGDDTSGLLAALKFDLTAQSTTESEFVSPFDVALDQMSEYSSVSAGALTVNGVEIEIDPATTTVRGLMSTLNGIVNVFATVDENTGKIRIASERSTVALNLSDTSGLLSSFGISSGNYEGFAGVRKVTETQTDTITVTNASEVSSNVYAAAARFNDALSRLTPELRSGVETVFRTAIDSLAEAGAKGLSLSASGADSRVTVEAEKLASSMPSDPSVLTGIADRFAEQMSAISGPPAAEPRRELPLLQIGDKVAELASSRISGTLMLLQSLMASGVPNGSAKSAADAYSDKKVEKSEPFSKTF
jgi:hypothetical protein